MEDVTLPFFAELWAAEVRRLILRSVGQLSHAGMLHLGGTIPSEGSSFHTERGDDCGGLNPRHAHHQHCA